MRRPFGILGVLAATVLLLLTVVPIAAAGTLDQHQDTASTTDISFDGDDQVLAQTFTAGMTGKLDAVSLYIGVDDERDVAPGTTNVIVTISETEPTNQTPDSTLTSTIAHVGAQPAWTEFVFDTKPNIEAEHHYAIVVAAPANAIVTWGANGCEVDTYELGRALIHDERDSSPSWQPTSEWASTHDSNICWKDFAFRTYVTVTADATPTASATATATTAPTGTAVATPTATPIRTAAPTATVRVTAPPTTSGSETGGRGEGTWILVGMLGLAVAGVAALIIRPAVRRS